ncbi:MAG TPA: SpoIIE family protein phosphatase [Geodermatophilus sp.]|nr:SpoIIE family protein phosphatase [Geodermatophilus sp.]
MSDDGSVGPEVGAPGAGERAVLEEMARYRALVEHAPDAIVILDVATGRFVSVNRAAERLFGMSREALLLVGPVQLSPPVQPDGRSSAEAAAEYIAEALAGGRPRFEWTHRRADGTDIPCEVALLRLPSADRDLVRGSVLDVIDRREARKAREVVAAEQTARRAAEADAARLQAMVAGLNAIVWERDPWTWEFRFVSDRAEELLGYPVQQWVNDPGLWRRVIHPDDREEAVRRMEWGVAEARDFALTYRVRTADGRLVWLHHLAHVVRDEVGTARAVHAVLFDITEQKRRERSAELLAAASRVLAGAGSVEERLSAVAGLAIGELCDRASVWLRDDDGRYRPVAAAPADLAPQVLALAPVTTPAAIEEAYRAGRPFLIPEVTDDMRRAATQDDDQFAAVARMATRSILVAPLMSGGRVVGSLSLGTADGERRYDDADLALAGELAQRVATMVAAEKVAARERRLHEITVALSAAGTVAEAAAEVSTGLRHALGASVIVVCTLGEDGLLHLVHALGYPSDRVERFGTMRLSAPLPVTEAARTGRPVWLPDRDAWCQRFPVASESLLPGTQAGVALPLRVGNRVVGAVGATFGTPRDFDAAERGFLLTLAGQVAAAVERAGLADARREIADTLQRSLLPRSLPRLDRLAVTARYLPGARGASAGGDWYDVFPLDDGAVALVVGDVVGNGATAAAVMGQLRSALAAMLLEGHPPARALNLLDRFAAQVDGAHVSTVACLRLEPVSGRLTYSVAGHLPPLVLRADGAEYLDGGRGPALTVPGGGAHVEATTTLDLGSTLILYTDGLVERRDASLDDGLGRLAGAAVARRAAAPAALVDGLLDELVRGGEPADDIAVVAVRLLPPPLRLDLSAEPHQLLRVRRAMARWAGDVAVDADRGDDLQLAVGEAVANAVEHAYRSSGERGRVSLEVSADPDGGLTVTVGDTGRWRPAPADPGFRGRGLQIIDRVATGVDLRPGPTGTTLRFRLAPAAAPDAPAVHGGVPGAVPAGGRRRASVQFSERDGVRCIEIVGDLDLAGVAAVRDVLLDRLPGEGRPTRLDLSRLGHLSSVGLALLQEVARRAGERGPVDVVLPSAGPARRILDLTGLADAFRSR